MALEALDRDDDLASDSGSDAQEDQDAEQDGDPDADPAAGRRSAEVQALIDASGVVSGHHRGPPSASAWERARLRMISFPERGCQREEFHVVAAQGAARRLPGRAPGDG